MALIQRRVFYGKIGTGEQLIKHLQQGNELLARGGVEINSRVLSDHNSGRTDRVVVEFELEDPGDFDRIVGQAMEDSQTQASFGPWIETLNSLIHYAEVEHWHVH